MQYESPASSCYGQGLNFSKVGHSNFKVKVQSWYPVKGFVTKNTHMTAVARKGFLNHKI